MAKKVLFILIIATLIVLQRAYRWSPYPHKDRGGGYSYESIYRIMVTIRVLIMDLYFEAEMSYRKVQFIKQWTYQDNMSYAAEVIFEAQKQYNGLLITLRERYIEMKQWDVDYDQFAWRMAELQRECWDIENKIKMILEIDDFDAGGYILQMGYRRSGQAVQGPANKPQQKRKRGKDSIEDLVDLVFPHIKKAPKLHRKHSTTKGN